MSATDDQPLIPPSVTMNPPLRSCHVPKRTDSLDVSVYRPGRIFLQYVARMRSISQGDTAFRMTIRRAGG